MATNVYEGMLIFDSAHYARDAAGVARFVEELVKNAGGEVLASRLWEERRLAYAIKNQRKGAYWLVYFSADSSQLVGMNRTCQISEGVLRHLFLKVDPRLVEALVSHTLTEHVPTPRPAERAVAVAALDADIPFDELEGLN